MTISQRKRVQRYTEHKRIRSRIETPSTHNQTLSAQDKERTLKLQGRKTKAHTNAGSLTFHGESGRQRPGWICTHTSPDYDTQQNHQSQQEVNTPG